VARRQPLERRPGLEDLDRLGLGHQPHARAAVRLALDQALVLEAHQGGPDRRARHPELGAHVGLHEALIRRELAAHDRLPEPEVAVVGGKA
jgi:hypothetical protein